MKERISNSIVCCYLYTISKYGYPPPAERTLSYIDEMYDLGFSSIELEGIRKEHLLEVYNIRHEMRKLIREKQMEVPYFCAVLPGMSSAEKKERDENLRLFEKGCRIAEILGSRGILDNAPLPPYRFPEHIPVVRHYDGDILLNAALPGNLDWSTYWDDLTGTFREACDIAAHHGLTYQLHPCLGVLAASADSFLYFYDAVKRENLRFNFDTANQFMMRENLILSFIRLKHHIDYIHISDNRGDRTEHLNPGEGHINWNQFFDLLDSVGFDGHIGLDIGGEENPPDDLDQLYKNAAIFVDEKWTHRIRQK